MLGSNYPTILQFCVAAILVNNIVLAEGVIDDGIVEEQLYLKKSIIVGISMIIITFFTAVLHSFILNYVLIPFSFEFSSIIFAGMLSLCCTYLYCFLLKKKRPMLFHKFLALEKTLLACNFITHILVIDGAEGFTFIGLILFATLQAVGFAIFVIIDGAIAEERISIANIPDAIKGIPIAIISFGLMALAFHPFMTSFF